MPFGSCPTYLVFIKLSFLYEMEESSLRFWMPQTFDEEKECVINSSPKSTVYKNNWAFQFFF